MAAERSRWARPGQTVRLQNAIYPALRSVQRSGWANRGLLTHSDGMARPGIRRIGKAAIAIVVVVVAALALLWAIWWLWSRLAPQWDPRTVIAISIVAVALLAAIWWLWWSLPRRQVRKLDIQIHDPKDRADTEDNFRKTVGQALGGAAVLVGAVAAYLQFTQQQQASHDLLISNQVSKGFEQLANDKITERLGGVYALEGVMNTSDQYYQSVLEALCAFVRDSTTRQKGPFVLLLETLFSAPREGTARSTSDKPPNDIQAALTVIGRRKQGLGRVDLARANIQGADLSSAHLDYADLSDAHLNNANLSDAFLIGAYLNNTNLSGADLSDARNLTQAQLDEACGRPKALPPGLTLDEPCPPRPRAQ